MLLGTAHQAGVCAPSSCVALTGLHTLDDAGTPCSCQLPRFLEMTQPLSPVVAIGCDVLPKPCPVRVKMVWMLRSCAHRKGVVQ